MQFVCKLTAADSVSLLPLDDFFQCRHGEILSIMMDVCKRKSILMDGKICLKRNIKIEESRKLGYILSRNPQKWIKVIQNV
jgi:hypothetical protein